MVAVEWNCAGTAGRAEAVLALVQQVPQPPAHIVRALDRRATSATLD